jgi:hypothetical protein
MDDMAVPTTKLADFGDLLALHVAHMGLGGGYRPGPGVWTLWFPVNADAYADALGRFLSEHPGAAGRAVRAASTPMGTTIN